MKMNDDAEISGLVICYTDSLLLRGKLLLYKNIWSTEVVLLNEEVISVSIEYKNEAMKFYMDMAE